MKPTISTIERAQTYALDRAYTGIGANALLTEISQTIKFVSLYNNNNNNNNNKQNVILKKFKDDDKEIRRFIFYLYYLKKRAG